MSRFLSSKEKFKTWCAEVKQDEPVLVNVGFQKLLHISHVALGEVDAGNYEKNTTLKVRIGGKQIVMGTLSYDRAPHTALNLVFGQELELSHNGEHGSVFFFGHLIDFSGHQKRKRRARRHPLVKLQQQPQRFNRRHNLQVNCSVAHLTTRVAKQKDEGECLALAYADMIGTCFRMNGYSGLYLSAQNLINSGYKTAAEMRDIVVNVGLHDIRRNSLTMLRKNKNDKLTYLKGETSYHVNKINIIEKPEDIEQAILENFADDGPNYPLKGSLYMGALESSSVARYAYDHKPFRHNDVIDPAKETRHAILIVGVNNTYPDPELNHCLVKNSWGPKWGKGGYTKVAFSVFESVDIPVFSDPISGDVLTKKPVD